MARRYRDTCVHLREDQIGRLRALSAATRVPQSELVRQGINMVLARHAEPKAGRVLAPGGKRRVRAGKRRKRGAG